MRLLCAQRADLHILALGGEEPRLGRVRQTWLHSSDYDHIPTSSVHWGTDATVEQEKQAVAGSSDFRNGPEP